MGPPTQGSILSLRRLVNQGHHVVIFTARAGSEGGRKSVADWMEHFQIPYHEISAIKKSDYDLYIDNRGIHFDSWPQVMNNLRRILDSRDSYLTFVNESYKIKS